MLPVNFRSYRKKLSFYRKSFRNFLNKTAKEPPKGITRLISNTEPLVWKEIDCLSCGNCCKKMTPTFTKKDITRISAHFRETPEAFTKKWLKKDSSKDVVNKTQPCQFLNLKDNKCSIYAIRPADCAGFPHLGNKNWKDYAPLHKQNIDYCPATYRFIEKIMELAEAKK